MSSVEVVPINPIATASATRRLDLEFEFEEVVLSIAIGPELEAKNDASGETRAREVRFLVDEKCWCWCWYNRDLDCGGNRAGRPHCDCDCDCVERRRMDEKGTCVRVDHMVLNRRAEESQEKRSRRSGC